MYHRFTGYVGNLKTMTSQGPARHASGARHRNRRQGHAAEESARPRDVPQAQGVRRCRTSAYRPAAAGAGHSNARKIRIMANLSKITAPAAARPPPPACSCARARAASSSTARPLDQFFGRETSRMIVRQPLELIQSYRQVRRQRHRRRRRHHRPGRRDPSRHRPRTGRVRRNAEVAAAQGRLHDPRRPRGRAQEGRSAQGPPRYAVLEALITLRRVRCIKSERDRSAGFWEIV